MSKDFMAYQNPEPAYALYFRGITIIMSPLGQAEVSVSDFDLRVSETQVTRLSATESAETSGLRCVMPRISYKYCNLHFKCYFV
jgi:hypothetical protein